jgi:hypothetical protein
MASFLNSSVCSSPSQKTSLPNWSTRSNKSATLKVKLYMNRAKRSKIFGLDTSLRVKFIHTSK